MGQMSGALTLGYSGSIYVSVVSLSYFSLEPRAQVKYFTFTETTDIANVKYPRSLGNLVGV